MRKPLLLAASLAAVAAVAAVTITPLCGQLFDCGCTFAGMGNCNILEPGPPDCPWCSYGKSGFYLPFAAIFAVAAAGTAASLRASGWRWWVAVIGGLGSYLGGAVLVGWLTALYRGYPVFLWWRW